MLRQRRCITSRTFPGFVNPQETESFDIGRPPGVGKNRRVNSRRIRKSESSTARVLLCPDHDAQSRGDRARSYLPSYLLTTRGWLFRGCSCINLSPPMARRIWESDRHQISDATESRDGTDLDAMDLGDGGRLRRQAAGFGGISPMPRCWWDLARCTRWAPGGRMSALSSPRLRTFCESPPVATVGSLCLEASFRG